MARNIRLIAAGTEDTHDFCINEKGGLIEVSGIDAYAQIINCKMRTILGEKQLNMGDGLPYMQTIFSDRTTIPIWVAEVRKMLEALPFVISVERISTNVEDGVLSYESVIRTDLGDTAFSGKVRQKSIMDSKKMMYEVFNPSQSGDSSESERLDINGIISFSVGDGVMPIAPISKKVGTPIKLPIPFKSGYVFGGWVRKGTSLFFTNTVMPRGTTVLEPIFYDDEKPGTRLKFEINDLDPVIKLRIWRRDDADGVTIDWGDGTIKKYECNTSAADAEGDDQLINRATLVSHTYSNIRYAIVTIGNECYKFKVGEFDVTVGSRSPDESQLRLVELIRWGAVNNAYRTFSYCPNLKKIPAYSNSLSYLVATFEETGIENIVPWPNAATNVSWCYKGCAFINGKIPILTRNITGASHTFEASSVDAPDFTYEEVLMPKTVLNHENYVLGCKPEVANLYYVSWGGALPDPIVGT